jgi:hypothetical protein
MIQISKYGHAIFIAILGMCIPITFENLMGNLIGGLMIGLALRLARESGREETEK